MIINGIDFTIGADPEVFLIEGGVPISAHNVIPGTKKEPHLVKGGAVQVDGMALEFNIDPASEEEDFLSNITEVMSTLKSMLGNDRDILIEPTAEFEEGYIKSQPPESLELGCDSDYNAWENGARNPPPSSGVSFRSAGGHVHIGWGSDINTYDPSHMDACIHLTRFLDYYLYLPSLIWDNDTKRAELYGKPGSFRPKSYGMEYRVLSNAWVKHPSLIKLVFSLVGSAIKAAFRTSTAPQKYTIDQRVRLFKRKGSKGYLEFLRNSRVIDKHQSILLNEWRNGNV